MKVNEAQTILEKFGCGKNAISAAIAFGESTRGRNCDRLDRYEMLAKAEACGARRIFRVNCSWPDNAEAHEVDCILEYRFENGPKIGRGYKWESCT